MTGVDAAQAARGAHAPAATRAATAARQIRHHRHDLELSQHDVAGLPFVVLIARHGASLRAPTTVLMPV